MISVKNIVLTKIKKKKRYINKKKWSWEEQFKAIVFSGLRTMPYNFLRPKNLFYILKKLGII
jgi:hypothetical protein